MNEDKLNQENEATIASLSPSSAPLVRQILSKGHVPEILTCIANLSSDEVFTPPELVDKLLDIFPEEVWHDSSLKWLDPACKTGIFLRQIAKRLMEGLRDEFPDEEVRRQHIFKNMLYGIAITDLRPAGKCKIEDIEFDVRAENGYIKKGSQVRISRIHENTIMIKEV